MEFRGNWRGKSRLLLTGLLASVFAVVGLGAGNGGAASSAVSLSVTSSHPAWVGNQGYRYSLHVVVTNTGSTSSAPVVLQETVDSVEQILSTYAVNADPGIACTSVVGTTATCNVGALAPGASVDFGFDMQVNGSSTGQVNHSASVTDGTVSASESDSIPLRDASTSDLRWYFFGDSADAPGLETMSWHLYDDGPSAAANTTVEISVPAGVTISRLETTIGTCSIATKSCDLGGGAFSGPNITLGIVGPQNESITVSVLASTTSVDPDLSNNTNSVTFTTCCPPAGGGGGSGGGGGGAQLPFSFVSTLPHATASMHYSFSSVTGDTGPWNVTAVAGALPAGMNLSSSGVLAGAPYESGRYTFTLEATDPFSNAPPIRATFTLIVDPNQDFTTSSPGPSAKLVGRTILLAKRTKTSGCKRGVLPDRHCSPGAYYSKATKAVVCSPTFRTGTVRNVPDSEKHQVEVEYGMAPKTYGRTIEIDRIVSLELGGSNDIANLYPEPGSGPASYHVKDKLENKLHKLVCDGSMTLHEAQLGIARNWETLYKTVFDVAP